MRSGLKRFQRIHLFAETDELDGFASDRPANRQGRNRPRPSPSMRVSTTPGNANAGSLKVFSGQLYGVLDRSRPSD